MALSLKHLAALLPWHRKEPHADELYGAIVAQARLPIFYQGLEEGGFAVPDSLEGRFLMLTLHLFAVLNKLKEAGTAEAAAMAQALADRFSADMEAVLRELGVGDLSVPKKVRTLVASGAAQLESFAVALRAGEPALKRAIATVLPEDVIDADAVSARLSPYVQRVVRNLENESVAEICTGTLRFPKS